MVIGRQGAEIAKLRATCEEMLKKPVAIDIVEIMDTPMTATT